MENGNAKERRIAQELELLKQYQRVSVKDLAATLEVSEMTIRRDLDLLRKNHVLERSYGYATLAKGGDGYAYDGEVYDLRLARIQNLSEKDRIAKYAATLIEPGDWIFLDNGTTVGRITSYLPTDFEFTVLCYNFTILAELLKRPNIKIIFPGGYYHRRITILPLRKLWILFAGTVPTNPLFLSQGSIAVWALPVSMLILWIVKEH
mgnify:CR=1 FL=1